MCYHAAVDLIDIGVNLTNKRFARDLPAVLERARAAGVGQLIITGTSIAGSRAAADLAAAHGLVATAGVHPHEASGFDARSVDALAALAERPEVVAIGECGLDFDRDFSPRPAQRAAFEAQLDLAVALRLPVFLHERAAHEEFARALAARIDRLPAAVVHCFTGDADTLDAYLEMGAHIGITGWICDERRGGALQACVSRIPLDRVLLETDAPYLTPRDLRPKPRDGRNEPAFLPHVAGAVAHHMGVEPSALAAASVANTRRVFGLPPGPRRT